MCTEFEISCIVFDRADLQKKMIMAIYGESWRFGTVMYCGGERDTIVNYDYKL